MLEQPMCRDNSFSLYRLICEDKSGTVSSDVSLTKCEIEVKENIVIIKFIMVVLTTCTA